MGNVSFADKEAVTSCGVCRNKTLSESVEDMIFGEEEAVKLLKKRLKAAGCDMDKVKKWTRQLAALKRQSQATTRAYREALDNLAALERRMKDLQERLINTRSWGREQLRQLQNLGRELKKMKDSYNHEFVVSREDKEFHLICDTITRMLGAASGADDARILLLSEVENLRAMIGEKLEREKPDPIMLTYFYLNHGDAELVDLAPEKRIEEIRGVYEQEFLHPILVCANKAGMTEAEILDIIREVV